MLWYLEPNSSPMDYRLEEKMISQLCGSFQPIVVNIAVISHRYPVACYTSANQIAIMIKTSTSP